MLKIWLETELYWGGVDFPEVAENSWLSLDKFKTKNWIKVKLSEEYYSNTIEYNFGITDEEEEFDKQVQYLEKEKNKYDLALNSSWPQFVGTHIHLFDDKFIKRWYNKDKLLLSILWFILKNKDCLSNLSINRLVSWHQLWSHYSYKRDNDWYRLVWSFNRIYYYENSSSKPKYQPIIKSKATDAGKPTSLELRLIPNEYVFNWKLKELLGLIESEEIFEYKIDDYLDFFRKLLWLWRSPELTESTASSTAYINGLYSSAFEDALTRLSASRTRANLYSPGHITPTSSEEPETNRYRGIPADYKLIGLDWPVNTLIWKYWNYLYYPEASSDFLIWDTVVIDIRMLNLYSEARRDFAYEFNNNPTFNSVVMRYFSITELKNSVPWLDWMLWF